MKLLARLAVAIAALVLLSACVISGPTDLVSEAEAVTPLPDFTFYPYAERDGVYVLSEDDPMPFRQVGQHYEAGDGKMVVRFAPLDGDTRIVAVIGEDKQAFFGTATITDNVISLLLVLDSGLSPEVLSAMDNVPADIAADMVPSQGGIIVTRRDTLDFVITRLRDGGIPASPLLGWVGTSDDAPPARLVPNGGHYEPAD